MTTSTETKAPRISALDFTKGMLVLFMVLYHWLNYFYSPEGDIYRYIRFVTPSFIFITGFLISSVYLSKYEVSDPRLPKRLLQRGLKILGIFVFLNLTISALLSLSSHGKVLFWQLSFADIVAIYLRGYTVVAGSGKAASFYILVPISYLLLLSAGLLFLCRFFKYTFHLACVLSFLCILILELKGWKSANLELFTVGLLGVVFGYLPLHRINRLVEYPYILAFAYLCYLLAITFWNATYPLQVIGVCLSVAIIYLLGLKSGEPARIRTRVILLGKYSLFGYIAQLAIIQMLYKGLRNADLGVGTLIASFPAAFLLIWIAVEGLDWARTKSSLVDGLYKAVFA